MYIKILRTISLLAASLTLPLHPPACNQKYLCNFTDLVSKVWACLVSQPALPQTVMDQTKTEEINRKMLQQGINSSQLLPLHL